MTNKILEINDVSFNVGGNTILSHLDFSVNKGEHITVTGPSGGGKSTLLKVIASMLTQTEGSIIYKGKNIQEINPIEYRKKVSYLFQNPALFDSTVKDNLAFPSSIRDDKFDEAKSIQLLERVSLDKSYLSKQVKELSGGEKQRIALIRNILYKPDILLLDEVTSSLDMENKNILHDIIGELNDKDKITILSVSHDEEEIKRANRVIRIIDGKVDTN
ncbi:MAG: ATP-binding cassette domain-containing protein [Alkalibacterium sp.]|uniref:Putative ABC transport system ATP-binding protein n=2 Tax=Alkalibacterium TaxID=99906 RepID=A0A1H6V5R5_9LACT|nr:ATP-binding cassette domain-containing protein [Alkalibacterium gilvum]MDN6294142.1 ATP-binding cassette domain-containing protein [Alkalibacterium sp.]MDN6729484.1 ATP-binding cassette domain-containing protein [Alkalibacterium sp.]SEI95990.1 putative ABC transport system ATP-binding protein [Alkalibacterium gilvum]